MALKLTVFLLFLCSIQSVFCAIGLEGFDTEARNEILTWRNKCATANEVTEEMLAEVKRGIFKKDPKIKGYIACLWLVSEVMDTNFNINTSKFVRYLPKDLSQEKAQAYRNCYRLSKSLGKLVTFVDKVWLMTQCNYLESKESFILF